MAHFLITYDNRPPRNYDALYNLMAQWGAVRLSQSVWVATLFAPASQVLAAVRSRLQIDDLITVVELRSGADWATNRASKAANGWLSDNIRVAEGIV